jgi:hypothetical protein
VSKLFEAADCEFYVHQRQEDFQMSVDLVIIVCVAAFLAGYMYGEKS